ncbi:response regulator [Sporomusa aerivorans]|uniref:response regulator n=1 Tax=Sporomusa aerivorans TaxID=204936 RepID=UPI00352B2674
MLGKKLLLIEDDSFMREMITLVLESEDYEVTGAGDGRGALRLLKDSGGYDAVISDMYLPDTDGLELFAQINALQPELAFLLLTSETDETIVRKATGLGISYILKDENYAEAILSALRQSCTRPNG